MASPKKSLSSGVWTDTVIPGEPLTTQILLEIAKGAAVGGLIGYLTNQLAVSMLFHPKRQWRFLGMAVPLTPGLVVKNQERLAEAIGSAVANDLLDAETLATHLMQIDLAAPIRRALIQERASIAASEKPLAEFLGDAHRPALEKVRDTVSRDLSRRCAEWSTRLEAPDSEAAKALRRILEEVAQTPISHFLASEEPARQERLQALRNWILARVDEYAEGETPRAHLRRATGFLLERLPDAGVFEPLETIARDALQPRMPEIAGRIQDAIAAYLASPDFEHQARDPLATRLYALIIQKFPMAAMVIGERTIAELLEQRWADLVEGGRDLVLGEQTAQFIEAQIEGSVTDLFALLREQMAGGATREKLADLLGDQLTDGLRQWLSGSEGAEIVDEMLENLCAKSPAEITGGDMRWIDELSRVALGRLAGWIRHPEGQAWLGDLIRRGAENLLFVKPVKELIEFLPEGEWEAMSIVLGETFENRAHRVLPTVLQENVNIAGVVTEKIRIFDTDRMEEIIQRVSGRELKGIVRLGGVIGIMVGAVTQVIYWWLG